MEIEFYPSTEADNDRALAMARGLVVDPLRFNLQSQDEVTVVLKKTGRVKVVRVKETA
jgi:hypothetical protein